MNLDFYRQRLCLGLSLIGTIGTVLLSGHLVLGCSLEKDTLACAIEKFGTPDPHAALLKCVSLNDQSQSNYIVSDLEGVELEVRVKAKDNATDVKNNIIKIHYSLTNKRAQKIGILNKLPSSNSRDFGGAPPFYPILNRYSPKYFAVVRGWDRKTDHNHASIRMFLAKPRGDAVSPSVEYLVIPERTIIASGETISEVFELNRFGFTSIHNPRFPSLKQLGFKFCVQIFLDEDILADLPDQPLVRNLDFELPHLDKDVYSKRTKESLPKLPNSQLLCKAAVLEVTP